MIASKRPSSTVTTPSCSRSGSSSASAPRVCARSRIATVIPSAR